MIKPLAVGALLVGLGSLGYKSWSTGGTMKVEEAPWPALLASGKYKVVMYSHSDCSPCTKMRRVLVAERIVVIEHFIDRNGERMGEMIDKLKDAKRDTAGVVLPSLEVNGVMMPNNPTIEAIKAQMLKAGNRG